MNNLLLISEPVRTNPKRRVRTLFLNVLTLFRKGIVVISIRIIQSSLKVRIPIKCIIY
jgi:hypothetical protein